VFLHGRNPVIGVLHADEEHYYKLAEKYFRQVEVFTCVSNRVNKITKERIPGFNPEKIFTIPCGINLPEIDFDTHSGNILQLVYVGRISEYQKRTSDLVKICANLQEKKLMFHLDIIGDGANAKTALESKFKQASLEEYVTFHGWLSQKEVGKYLSESDVLILTSDFEGTPVVMMEAFASGCGMVGTRVSGIEDYEYHPLAADCLGVYVTGDIEDAVKKIVKVASVPKGVRQSAARKIAESEFSMQVCLEKYIKAIETVETHAWASPGIRLSTIDLVRSKAIAVARYLKILATQKS